MAAIAYVIVVPIRPVTALIATDLR
jgi:hypothetical protein